MPQKFLNMLLVISRHCLGINWPILHYFFFFFLSSSATKNSSSTVTGTLKPKTSHRNTTLRTIGRPRKRRQGGALLGSLLRRQMKKMKRQNTNSNSSCGILDGCTRICVGQNEKFTHVSDCTQFKIKCTSKRLFRSRSRTGRGKDKRKNPRRNN